MEPVASFSPEKSGQEGAEGMSEHKPRVVSRGERLLFHIDRLLSGHPLGRFMLLGGLALFVILIVAILRQFAAEVSGDEDFLSSVWWSLIATLDPVKFADEETYLTRLVGVLSSICGLVVVASLIGLVNSSIEERLEALRKGKSAVIAEKHTLLLGWDQERCMSVLKNLDANARVKREARMVVVLSEADKNEVEDIIYNDLPPGKCNLDIIVRTASTGDVQALEKLNAGQASTIIIINPELNRSADLTSIVIDMPSIHTLLALKQIKRDKSIPLSLVTELSGRNREKIMRHIAGADVRCVVMKEVLSRIMVQCSRIPNLAAIYEDLLSPVGAGVDFYFREFPELRGLRFNEVQCRLYRAVAVGYERRDPETGEAQVLMNPDPESVLTEHDSLLVLANNSDNYFVGEVRKVKMANAVKNVVKTRQPPEYFCVLGYSSKVSFLLREYDSYLSPGSVIYMLTGLPRESMKIPELENIELVFLEGDPTDDGSLEQIPRLSKKVSCVIVLAREDCDTQKEADAKTTISVILMSMAFNDTENKPRVICEILDASSKDLLDEELGIEFVLSTEVTSRLISQVAEDKRVAAVYDDCFDPDGSEIYLKTPGFYAPPGVPVKWLSVQAVAATVHEVAIGYLKDGEHHLNPDQDEELVFGGDDRLIVMSEDDGDFSSN